MGHLCFPSLRPLTVVLKSDFVLIRQRIYFSIKLSKTFFHITLSWRCEIQRLISTQSSICEHEKNFKMYEIFEKQLRGNLKYAMGFYAKFCIFQCTFRSFTISLSKKIFWIKNMKTPEKAVLVQADNFVLF